MKRTFFYFSLMAGCVVLSAFVWKASSTEPMQQQAASAFEQQVEQNRTQLFQQGKQVFRFDTFGDEAFWGGALHLHQAIAWEKNGGVGPGVSRKTARGGG